MQDICFLFCVGLYVYPIAGHRGRIIFYPWKFFKNTCLNKNRRFLPIFRQKTAILFFKNANFSKSKRVKTDRVGLGKKIPNTRLIRPNRQHDQSAAFHGFDAALLSEFGQFRVFGARVEDNPLRFKRKDVIVILWLASGTDI